MILKTKKYNQKYLNSILPSDNISFPIIYSILSINTNMVNLDFTKFTMTVSRKRI